MERKIKETIGETQKVLLEDDSISKKEHGWDVNNAQVESGTKLEDDTGTGKAVIVRRFTFGANPQAFKLHKPTKQELFNHHLKQIEIMLWGDGMKIMTEVEPRLYFNKKKTQYSIVVGAIPQRGQMLLQQPQLLKDLAQNKLSV